MTPPRSGPSPALLDAVDAVFRERVEDGTTPSSVWGVFDATRLVASNGHGDRGDGRAPDADTVYRIASCTKSVTAASVLLLAERRKLDLDQPITDFVPAFADVALPSADAPVPTIRMLLTMSGGFPTDDPWADRQEATHDEDLDHVLRAGLLFDSVPGTRYAYSNLGYALLGRVVARASGRSYQEFATKEILDPVGLPATSFRAPTNGPYVVRGARRHDGAWERLPLSGPGAFSSIGGLFSSVTDLSRWARTLSSAFRPVVGGRSAGRLGGPGSRPAGTARPAHAAGGGDSPVARSDRRAMQQAYRMIPSPTSGSRQRPMGYGFGLFVEHDARVGTIASHSGGYPGFSAHMRWSVETGVGVVAFENATGSRVAVAAEEAHDLLLAGLPAPVRTAAVLDATRAAQRAVTALLQDFTDERADAVCTPNVAMDVPYDRRRAAIRTAVAEVGADLDATPVGEESTAPTHLVWRLPGTSGTLRVEIRLAPLGAGLVQTLIVRAEPT